VAFQALTAVQQYDDSLLENQEHYYSSSSPSINSHLNSK